MSFNLATMVQEAAAAHPDKPACLAGSETLTYPGLYAESGSGIVNVAIRYGVTLALCPRFEPDVVFELIERHRASVFAGVPTMFYSLLDADPAGRDLSSLRIASSRGASLPGAVLSRFEERFGVPILEGYGLTETASSSTLNRESDRRVLPVGKPLWGVEVAVAARSGRRLGPGESTVGEVLVRGFNVMKGYHANPSATAEAVRDGWLHTGDLGYLDEDGFLYLVDRLKDLIIRGGYNVYPREVEEVLYAHPAWPRRPSSAGRTTAGVRKSWRSSRSIPGRRRRPTISSRSAVTGSRRTSAP